MGGGFVGADNKYTVVWRLQGGAKPQQPGSQGVMQDATWGAGRHTPCRAQRAPHIVAASGVAPSVAHASGSGNGVEVGEGED